MQGRRDFHQRLEAFAPRWVTLGRHLAHHARDHAINFLRNAGPDVARRRWVCFKNLHHQFVDVVAVERGFTGQKLIEHHPE